MSNLLDKLDDIDWQLLKLMQADGRITNADLARLVKLSPPSVLQRVRKLEDLGLIRGYLALLDQEKLGFGLTVFAQISLALHQEEPIERFRKAIQDIPEVLECYHVSGEFDFLLKIVVEDMKAYEALVRSRLSKIKGLGKIQSCFALATNKQTYALPLGRR